MKITSFFCLFIITVSAQATSQPNQGPRFLNRFTLLAHQINSSGGVKKLLTGKIGSDAPDHITGIPGHDGNNAAGASTTDYGGTGLTLTLLSILGFLIGGILGIIYLFGEFVSANQYYSNGSSSNSDGVVIGIILVASLIAFIVGFIYNVQGANKQDKHYGDATAGLIIDIIIISFILLGLLLSAL